MKIQDKLVCPKCRTRNLRKAHGRNPIGEMFCDRDRIYFTIWELVNIWGFDAGDFVNNNGVSLLPNKIKISSSHGTLVSFSPTTLKFYPNTRIDTLSMFEGEPLWQSPQEREEAYEMVHRMFLGIPEYDDYQDLKNTQDSALGRML